MEAAREGFSAAFGAVVTTLSYIPPRSPNPPEEGYLAFRAMNAALTLLPEKVRKIERVIGLPRRRRC